MDFVKMVQNGPKWSKMIQHFHNGLIWSNRVQNGSKWSKKGKMVQNGPNGSKWFKKCLMVQMVQIFSKMVQYGQNSSISN